MDYTDPDESVDNQLAIQSLDGTDADSLSNESVTNNSEVAPTPSTDYHSPVIRGNSLYTIVKGPSWKEAETRSQELGGHLAAIGNEDENAFLVNTYPNQPAHYMYWIGLNDADTEGVYSWSNNEPVTYYNWRPTSGPNRSPSDTNSIGPSYIEFQVNDLNESTAGQWNDIANDAYHVDGGPGIAEIPLNLAISTEAPNTAGTWSIGSISLLVPRNQATLQRVRKFIGTFLGSMTMN